MLHYSLPTTMYIDCILRSDDQRGRGHLIVAHNSTPVAGSARAPLKEASCFSFSWLTSCQFGCVGNWSLGLPDELKETFGRFYYYHS